MKYRKKPIALVEASQWFKIDDHPSVRAVPYDRQAASNGWGWIDDLEGGHFVQPGDWIIIDVRGEYYSCKPDIFAETYESATEGEVAPPSPETLERPFEDVEEALTACYNEMMQHNQQPWVRLCLRQLKAAVNVLHKAATAASRETDYDRFKAEHPALLAAAEAELDADEKIAASRETVPPQQHQCAGCHHRWEGRLPGGEFCGICHRIAVAAIHGAAPQDSTVQQLEADLKTLALAIHPEMTGAWAIKDLAALAVAHRSDSEDRDATEAKGRETAPQEPK